MQSIEVEWKGESYVIGAAEAFALGEEIEDVVTLAELAAMAKRPKFHKLAKCYAIMIRHAGGTATPVEVHAEMMGQIKGGIAERRLVALDAVTALVTILMDGAPESDGDGAGKTKGGSSNDATR